MMMFFGMISSAMSGAQLLAAHAIAQRDSDGALGGFLSETYLSSSATISRGVKSSRASS